jgi:lamin tail-like protein
VFRRRSLLITLCALLAFGGLFRVAALRKENPTASTGVVISQIYGGGGNSGATFKSDFIELFNSSTSPVDVTNWSIQYASPTSANWQVTLLCPSGSCTIAPGHYFLIQEAQGAAGTSDLPTPNAIGNIAMGSLAGKVALVSSTTPLSAPCGLGGSGVDFVGYGAANCWEGSNSPSGTSAPSNTTAVLRINNGCTDTDNNHSDFITGAPNPRNSSSPAITCGVSPSPSPTASPTPTPNCGVERWSVKTGTDNDAHSVSFVSQSTTIATMRSWTAPSPIPANNRVSPFETTVWTINANLLEYKFEDDSDYHIVLQDAAGNTIIGEIPNPGCVGSGSPFAASITNARLKFNAMFTAGTSFQFANVPVQVTGVGMFDFLHGQTGVAPNGIELHPILDIVFANSSSPQLATNESANNEAAAVNLLLMRDPFDVTNTSEWLNAGADRNTRIILFAGNLQLAQNETASSVVVRLIDSTNNVFEVPAEDVRAVPNHTFAQITFRLPDDIASGASVVTIKAHGQTSNSGTINIR